MPPPISEQPQDTPLLPACAAARDWLQARLDRDEGSPPSEVREHLLDCGECRALDNAATVLLNALPKMRLEEPAHGFASRVLDRALATPHRPWHRQRLVGIAGLALAASLLIGILAVIHEGQAPIRVRESVVFAPPPKPIEPAVVEKPVPLRESLQEASNAVAALTRRATSESFGLRLPKLPTAKMDAMPKVDPPPASFQDVRDSAALGIAPITDSAKRALNALWRELTPNMEGKPVSN